MYKRTKIRTSFQDKKSILFRATDLTLLIVISSKKMPFMSKVKLDSINSSCKGS
jgi:hypothetical protein